jgi:hypothetical protein
MGWKCGSGRHWKRGTRVRGRRRDLNEWRWLYMKKYYCMVKMVKAIKISLYKNLKLFVKRSGLDGGVGRRWWTRRERWWTRRERWWRRRREKEVNGKEESVKGEERGREGDGDGDRDGDRDGDEDLNGDADGEREGDISKRILDIYNCRTWIYTHFSFIYQRHVRFYGGKF